MSGILRNEYIAYLFENNVYIREPVLYNNDIGCVVL